MGLYPDAVGEMPLYIPDPKVKHVRITTFADADHSHYLETKQSDTGVLMFLNKTPTQ